MACAMGCILSPLRGCRADLDYSGRFPRCFAPRADECVRSYTKLGQVVFAAGGFVLESGGEVIDVGGGDVDGHSF